MRRRSGLRSFPRRSPSTQGYPGSGSPPDASASSSPAPTPSAASPGPPAAHRTPCANGSTSAQRYRLPYKPEQSSSRSRSLPQSTSTDLPPAQAGTSCLVPYALLVQCLSSPLAHFKPGTPPTCATSKTPMELSQAIPFFWLISVALVCAMTSVTLLSW